ncbi:MAG: transcriptional regulator [Burkholderiaceae bacterium]|nr:transcriptional regulator [Burkholderiaceae bacterium]
MSIIAAAHPAHPAHPAAPAAPGFALTKIQPPRPRGRLIARPRLEQQLAQALAMLPLVLVSAPAGFGKTAAIARQVGQLGAGTALAWIAVDEDDDLGRLAACVVAALEPFDLPWRTSPEALVAMQDGQREARQVLASELLNALAATDVPRGLIVFDDLHRVTDPAVFEWLDALLERLPPHWGLLIAGRADPPLALARLRARGELAEFRQDALRFDDDEVADLVRLRAQGLPAGAGDAALPEAARALLGRTQGWPAGINLALAHSGRPGAAGQPAPAGSLLERHVFDYLTVEVLDNLEPALRDFLLRCAVLPELSLSRCVAVSGHSPAQAARQLEEIERRGLFVSVRGADAGSETVLCLHDLFRDCLAQRLRSELPGEWPRLQRLAADSEPDLVRRVGHLARAADWPAAEAALYAQGPSLLARGAVQPLLRLIEQFPAAVREASPRLAHLRGLCAWAHWDILTMCQCLAQAADGHQRHGDLAAAQRARSLLVLGLSAGGQVPRSVALLAQLRRQTMDLDAEVTAWQAESWHALAASRTGDVAAPLGRTMELLARSDDPVLWLQAVPLTSFVGLPGTAPAIQRYIDGALRLMPEEPPSTLRVMAHALQAGLWLGQGRVEEAASGLARVDADRRWLNRPPNLSGYYHLFLGLTQAVLGRREAALAAAQARLDGLDDERTSGRREVWLNHFLYARLRLAMMLDDAATVQAMADALALRASPQELPFFVRERRPLAGHQAALAGHWADAALHYARALDDEPGIDLYGQVIETRLRCAHALVMTRRLDEAAAVLRPLPGRLAAAGGHGAVFFAGSRVLAGLAAVPWGARLAAGEAQALQHWSRQLHGLRGRPDARPEVPPASAGARPEAGPVLSPREAEVLARMAAGDSNKLIARAFDLSPHTVKRHVANILDKLGLSSRGQAAAWYRGQRSGNG